MFAILALAVAQQPIALERIVAFDAGLQEPVDLQVRPDDDRLFVVQRRGLVRIVDGGSVLPTPFVDLTADVSSDFNVGLRAMAFAPDHAVSSHVYLWYDEETQPGAPNPNGVDGVLIRMKCMDTDADRLEPSSRVEILRVPQDGKSHGGGRIAFDFEGRLLLAIGDGMPGGDPMCRAQDRSNLLGSMIRIDVSGALPYTVPADNPFVGVAGVRPEILHYGLRHPWKWCVDPMTEDLWIADVGELQREEVNLISPGDEGLNFGWPALEGTQCFTGNGCVSRPDCSTPGLTAPVFEYDHGLGCSITGGYVATDSSVAELNGAFVFTDYCSHRIWSARSDGAGGTNVIEHAVTTYPSGVQLTLPATMGVDASGDLLVADYVDGEIYRLAPAESIGTVCDGEPNVTGGAADMLAQGTTSLSDNSLTLTVQGTAPFTLGVLFYGPAATAVPTGNGIRCVGPGNLSIFRAGVRVASDLGEMTFPLDLQAAPFSSGMSHVAAGSTWVFQTWYRDVGGPLGESTNFSGALAVRFRP